jgi:hypothetical protein
MSAESEQTELSYRVCKHDQAATTVLRATLPYQVLIAPSTEEGGAHSFHGGVAARTEREADVRQLFKVVRLHDLERRLRAARQQDRLEPAANPQPVLS